MAQRSYRITLAGREYPVRFGLKERVAIEDAINGPATIARRTALAAASHGILEENIAVLWAGIKHNFPEDSPLTPEGALDLASDHIERGGDFYADVYRPIVLRAFLESKVCGPFEPKKVDEWCGVWKEGETKPVTPQ